MSKRGPRAAKSGKKSAARPGNEALRRFRAANEALRAGRPEAAAKAYRGLIRTHGRQPELHNNLGIALKRLGKLDEAAESFRRAAALAPDYAAAQGNLAGLLAQLGRFEDSLPHYLAAERLDPANKAHRQGFATALRPIRFRTANAELRAAAACLLDDDGIDPQPLAPALLSLLRLEPAVQCALAAANDDDALLDWLTGSEASAFLEQPLLRRLLTRCILPDVAFERLLTGIRRLCLTEARAKEVMSGAPGFFAALACQSWLNDFAYAETMAERALLEVPASSDLLSPALLTYALYRPLAALPHAQDIAPQGDAVADLHRLQLREPLAEREIEADLPSLTPIDDATSQAVRQQYEDNPYPRWLSARAAEPRPLGAVLRELFPHQASLRSMPSDTALKVLVAGCGTGKHALDVARRFAGADVLAVDLSRRSLAYAARQARDLGQANLRFAQADLLSLAPGTQRYGLIESMGVLHHLEDPLAGWRRLLALLDDGGFMRIGLYSRTARRHLRTARDLVADCPRDPDGLRAARQRLIALPETDPARAVLGELDFYSLSGCRDLLFHVQEVGFSLAEIAAALDALGLDFLGFEFVDPTLPRAYAARFPQDKTLTDLDTWSSFEAENPESFRTMYQFWCRRRA